MMLMRDFVGALQSIFMFYGHGVSSSSSSAYRLCFLATFLLQDILELDNYMSQDWEERLQTGCFEADQACMKRIADRIVWHVAPIIMLAHSRTNLPAKTRVFLHTLALLCSSRSALCELCDSVVSLHTDYGTEKGISRISDCPLDLFFTIHACWRRGNWEGRF